MSSDLELQDVSVKKPTEYIFDIHENEYIDIPNDFIIGASGDIEINKEVFEHSLVEVSYRKGKISVRSGNYIGEIRLNKNVILNIKPKAPIANLMHIISCANSEIKILEYYKRFYGISSIESQNLKHFLVSCFIVELRHLLSEGIFKVYIEKEDIVNSPKGKISFSKTISQCVAKNHPNKLAVIDYNFTSDHELNQLIKYTIWFCLYQLPNFDGEKSKALKKNLYEIYEQFDNVTLDLSRKFIEKVNKIILDNSIPTLRSYYYNIINLSKEIINASILDLEKNTNNISLSAFVINVAYVFESYLLNLFKSNQYGFNVFDGNSDGKKKLFNDNNTYEAKPDYIYEDKDNNIRLVADAKYKKSAKETDRYQLISHALSYGANIAVCILPSFITREESLVYIGEIGGGHKINFYNYYLDLQNENIELVEQQLIDCISRLVNEA
ncbi:McrC family protein [Idiomarina sp. M1R2S28]|uniref:McrC family protein n=1 Tax=Idiomarina rhizosphaerae TaxID=2961572 RepID=A0A9X2JS30_9GAMM|nr:McrC family protein [Idiomarina rhizosphaerae]MCP1339403.1 McrC family protein [Idiomarina rhizosphaerae]